RAPRYGAPRACRLPRRAAARRCLRAQRHDRCQHGAAFDRAAAGRRDPGHGPRVQRLPQRRPSGRRRGRGTRGHGPGSISADDAVDAMLAKATPRTRLAMFSHVTSPTALVFPIATIAAALNERGIEVLIDGAHSPGQVPIDLDELERAGVTYYAGNGHKWIC